MKTLQSRDNLVWIDLEMTGLDPDKEKIIEIATLITDSSLNIIAEGPNLIISQPKEILKSMDCLLYTSPSPRDKTVSRMPSSA